MVVLSVPDESALDHEFTRLPSHVDRVMVSEPDLGDEHTAFAALGADAGRTLANLPLALREVAMA